MEKKNLNAIVKSTFAKTLSTRVPEVTFLVALRFGIDPLGNTLVSEEATSTYLSSDWTQRYYR